MPSRVDVLGPLRLTVAGEEVAVPGPKRRALLALLAVADGRTVPVEVLLDALWPSELPDTARATLQSHVSRLRRHLGAEAACLETLSGGYRLVLGPAGSDVASARALLAAAREAEPGEASLLLREAQSLWRGGPLAEFTEVAPLAATAVTLDELRRSVDAALVAAHLAAGDAGRAVVVATEHLASMPLSEAAVLLLMRCLHALGRSAEGLRVAYDYRRRLAEESGLEPTPALSALEGELATTTQRSTYVVARPAQPLRGRDSELAALRRLLSAERLVTVVGSGGVGKTRLAMEVAAGFEPATAVLLAAVTDERALPQAIAEALGLRVLRGDVLSACAALLAAGPRLLFLDNCEHLLAAVAQVVQRFLHASPELTVLATSREPLRLSAEQRLRLAPLPMTRPERLDDLSGSPAVALFVDRASRVREDLRLAPGDLDAISEIVRRVDGMPLAIELAASRLSSLGLQDLEARLDQALDLLGDDANGTLRHTIAWSYDLLPADEQRLLRFCGVFADGLDLSAAEALAATVAPDTAPLRVLGHLVEASMLDAVHGTTTRYRMLDTVRAFAAEKLVENGETDQATDYFLRWAFDLVAWIDATTHTPDEQRVDSVLRRELANLRAAWSLVRSLGRNADAVHMILGLMDAATWRDLTEVWDWSLDLAADPAVTESSDAPTVLGMAADSAWFRGDLDQADNLADAGMALAGAAEWYCADAKSLVALSRGDFDAAVRLATTAAQLAPRPVQSLAIAALASAYGGNPDAARAFSDQFREVACSPTLEAFHAYVEGEIAALAGQRDEAVRHYDAAVELGASVGSTFVQGVASLGRLSQFAAAGDTNRALAGYRSLIDYWERTGSWIQQWTTLRNLADLLETIGVGDAATFLRGAASLAPDAPWLPGTGSAPPPIAGQVRRDHVLAVARDAIARALA